MRNSAVSTGFMALILLLSAGYAFAQNWTTCASPSIPRWCPGSAVIGSNIYLIGGQDSIPPFTSIPDVEVYDTVTDTWSAVSPMSNARWGLMVSVVDGKIYAIGGQTGSFMEGYTATDYVEEYDPATDTWTELSPLPTSRGWGGSAVCSDTIFVFGGYDPEVEETGMEVEKFYPATGTWSSDPLMPMYRETFSCIYMNGLIYIIGGWDNDLVQAYDPAAKTWTEPAPMLTGRGASGVCSFGDCIIVAGGRGGPEAVEAYCYDSDSWITMPSLPTPREGLIAETVNGKLFTITGSRPISEGGVPYYGIIECIELDD
ncbi:MAG: hypothetical protein KAR44_03035 [Candidatus Aegiribacteria sp.]|nr:hypothetical protein [Candidatus Aegiribacteria sp.]